jgi:hypothetical protein
VTGVTGKGDLLDFMIYIGSLNIFNRVESLFNTNLLNLPGPGTTVNIPRKLKKHCDRFGSYLG